MSGTILDAAGESLGGAKLTLSGEGIESRAVESDEVGRFAFDDVAAGRYVLRVEARNHLPLEVPLDVAPRPAPPLKIQMKVGIAEDVSVLGVSPDEERTAAANNADGLSLDDKLIRGLPVPIGSQGLTGVLSDLLSPASQGTGEPSILVDGADSPEIAIPTSAVRGVKINRDPYSAEYRRPGKDRVEIVTQDGSRRRFKGAAAFTWRNSGLDARNALSATKQYADKSLLELSFNGPLARRAGAPSSASFSLGLEYLTSTEDRIVNAQTLHGPVNATVPAEDRLARAMARVDLRAGLHRLWLRYDLNTESGTNRDVGGLRLPDQGYDGREGPAHVVDAAATLFLGRYVNDARVTFLARSRSAGRPPQGPALDVNGAFRGGEPQVHRTRDGLRFELRDVGTLTLGPHKLRFGGGLRRDSQDGIEERDFGGVFQFASLDELARGTPFVYRLNQGAPMLSLATWEADAFVQDEVKLADDLSLAAGLRYDWTSEIHDGNNIAPRLTLAYSPGSRKTVYRVGAGVFYERLPSAVSEQRRLENGETVRSLVVTSPSYPDPFLAGGAALVPPSIFRTATDLRTPYLVQATAAWERQIARWAFVTIEYGFLRGIHLFRCRDVNAPRPGTGLRPDPSRENVLEVGSDGSMDSHALTFTYRGRIGRRVKAIAQYTLARTRNDVPGSEPAGGFSFQVPADNYDWTNEYGRAGFDRRHRLSLAGMAKLPLHLEIGATLRAMSGAPLDITTGGDDNGDSYAQDRPPGVRRNTGEGPAFSQLDLRLTKTFDARSPFPGEKHRRGQIQVIVDAFNVLNHVNYGPYVGAMTSPFFGRAVVAKDPRTFQFAVRYSF